MAGDRHLHGRRRPDQPLRDVRRGRPRRRARAIRRAAATQRRGWKTRQAKSTERFQACFAARDWDALAEITGRRRFASTIAVGGGARGSDTVGTPTSRTCGQSPSVGVTNITSTVIATRGERLVLSRVLFSDRRPEAPEAFPRRGARHRRDRRRRPHRRRASRSTPTTSTPPSRSSTRDTSPAKRPPTHTRGRVIAGSTPRSTGTNCPRLTPDWVNIDHRLRIAIAPERHDRVHPCRVGPHAGLQGPHRGRASADRPRSGRHPGRHTAPRKRASTPSGGWSSFTTVDGDLISRGEIFDDTDLDPALARFEELHARPRRGARTTSILEHRTELGG